MRQVDVILWFAIFTKNNKVSNQEEHKLTNKMYQGPIFQLHV